MAIKLQLAVTAADPAPLNLLDRLSYQTPRQLTGPGVSGYPKYDAATETIPIRCIGASAAANWNAIATKLFEAPYGTGAWGLAQANVVLIVRYAGESADSYIDVVGGAYQLVDPYVPTGDRHGLALLSVLPGRRGQTATYGPFRVANGDRDQAYCLTVTGGAGTFTLTYGANTTSAQAWNVSASTLQSQFTGLASVGAGNATVYGTTSGNTSTYIIRFAGTLGNANQTLTTNGGAGGATATLTTSTSGAIWFPGLGGTMRGVARIKFDDKSAGSKVVNDIIVGTVGHPLLAATDVLPVIGVTPQAPGVAHANGASRRGTESRLTTTNAWSPIARALGPATGKSNGRRRILALGKTSDAIVGQPTALGVTTTSGAGSIGTATIQACIVPYNGSAPYVAGVNQLGQASDIVTASTILTQGLTQTLALTPLFSDGFETNSLVNWNPGPLSYANQTNTFLSSGTGGSASVTTGSSFKDTGSYGCQLTAVSPNDAASQHKLSVAMLVAQTITADPIQACHARIKIVTETNNTDTTTSQALRGFIHWAFISGTTLYGLATLDGTNFGLYLATTGIQKFGTATAVGVAPTGMYLQGSTFTLAAGFHDSELEIDVSNPSLIVARLVIDGTVQALSFISASSPTITSFGLTALAQSPINTVQATETFYVDNVTINNGYITPGNNISGNSYTYAWTPGENYGGALLKYNYGTVWNSLDVGNASTYTLSTLLPNGVTVNSAPPVTAPPNQLSQIRAAVGLQANTSPVFTIGTPKTFRLRNGKREWIDLGGFSLANRNRWEQANAPWLIQLEGINPNGGTTIDVEAVAILDEGPAPQKGLRAELSSLSLITTGEQWDYDTRPDLEASCVIRKTSDSSVEGEASVSGPLTISPGGSWIVPLLAEQDSNNNAVGDAVNLEMDVTTTFTPLYDVSAGV